jgi:hypothetical protein
MQEKQALHCNAEAAGATQKCRISRYYTVVHKLQVLLCNAEVAGAKL